jgi:hypothetical protein
MKDRVGMSFQRESERLITFFVARCSVADPDSSNPDPAFQVNPDLDPWF